MANKKQHPWRKCPIGEYRVKEHPRKVNKSEKNPDEVTIVDAHCRKNPSNILNFIFRSSL